MVHQQLPRGHRDYLQRRIPDEAVDTRRRIEQLWVLHRAEGNLPLGLDSRHGLTGRNDQCYGLVQLSDQKASLRIQIASLCCAVLSDSFLDIGRYYLVSAGYA